MASSRQDVTGIILAAGRGSRLGSELPCDTKAMLLVAGHPLLAFAFDFLRTLRIPRRVVVGNGRPEFHAAVERLDPEAVIVSVDYRPGNLHSFLSAFERTTGSLMVMNVDHLYDLAVAEQLPVSGEDIAVYGDFTKRPALDERGMVVDAEGRIQNIAKQLPDAHVTCVGLTYIPASARTRYAAAIPSTVARRGDQTGYEDVLQTLAMAGERLVAVDASGINPYEIDVPEEWRVADAGVAAEPHRFLRS